MEKGLYELGRDRRQLRNTLKESGFSVSKEEGIKKLKESINKETNKFKKIKLESLLRLWNETQDNINTNIKEITKTGKDNPWRELRAEYKRQKSEGKIGYISEQFNSPEKFQEISRLNIELEECEKAILEAEYLMKDNNLWAESLLNEFQKNKAQIQKELDELKEKNPTEYESYRIYSYHQDLKKEGHIARVESVREYLQKITDCIIEGKPMFLFGPTGTGKTSLARFAAKQLTGQSPEMIYCSPQTRESNIFGTKSLESKDGNTITSFDYGPLSKSAKEGRVLILDEFTSLPKEIMSIFKGIMNTKVGDEINIPGDGKVKIKQGFQIIFTANLKSDKNKERSDLPPEFANEVLFNNLKIGYPNQKESKEIFIARLLDENMTTNFSMYDIEETLPKLLKAIEEIQELYEGIENKEWKDKLEADPVKKDKLELKKLVLNQRSIENILGKWKLELRRNPNLSFVEFLDKSLATALNFDELKEDKLLVIKIFIKNGLLSTIDAKDLRLNEKDLNVFARSEMLKEREQTISKSKDRKILTLRDILGEEKGEKSIKDLKELFNVTSTGNITEKNTENKMSTEELIDRLEKIGGEKIQNCDYIHTKANGDLVGMVQINGIRYPFAGDKLIKEIGGEKIQGCYNIHTKANGDLAGIVRIGGRSYPFAGDKLIKEIEGEEIEGCYNIHTKANGDLAGRVQINGISYPFTGDKVIKEIEGEEIEGCYDIHTKANGDLAGRVQINGKWYPFTGDKVIKEIEGEEIEGCDNIHTKANGDLAGRVQINGISYPFTGDKVIKEIEGEEIEGCDNIHTKANGDLAGRVQINGISYPFTGDKVIKEIEGEEIEGCDDIHTQANGDLAGKVQINGKSYPFVGDKVIKEIEGEEIEGCDDIHTQANGDLVGMVQINGIRYPFAGDKLIKEIGGEKIQGCYNIHTKANGDLAGIVRIGGRSYPFAGDKIFK